MAKVKIPPMVQVDSFLMLDAMGDVVCSGKLDANKDGLCENSEYGVCVASGSVQIADACLDMLARFYLQMRLNHEADANNFRKQLQDALGNDDWWNSLLAHRPEEYTKTLEFRAVSRE